MGLRDLVANGVALADKLTADLQPPVYHLRWTGVNGFGEPTYDEVSFPAIVELKQQLVRDGDGEEKLSSHVISILREPKPQGTVGRSEPVDTRDKFRLADGTVGSILNYTGLEDSKTFGSYYYQVYLGG